LRRLRALVAWLPSSAYVARSAYAVVKVHPLWCVSLALWLYGTMDLPQCQVGIFHKYGTMFL
ncbi:MAG: hypothetical protein LUC06_04845, partial [Oscillospiraceae bacterium]|nr:hypothetical protein [Oscillospiraceae bacterium]